MFHWVNPVSSEVVHFHNDDSGKRNTCSSPMSFLSHWWERKRERNECCYHQEAPVHGLHTAWLMVKCRIRLASLDRHAFYLIKMCLSEYEKRPWREGSWATTHCHSSRVCESTWLKISFVQSVTDSSLPTWTLDKNECLSFDVGSYVAGQLIPLRSHPVLR